MQVSRDIFDVTLLALGAGVIFLNILLFGVYLLLRYHRRKDEVRSKSDRPFWVALTLLAGTFWLGSTLQLNGHVLLVPSNRVGCLVMRYWVQMAAGFVLWTVAVLYRMMRIYLTYTVMMRRPLKAAYCMLILMSPFLVLCVVASGVSPLVSSREHAGAVCMQPLVWNAVMYALLAVYFGVYLFLLAKLYRIRERLRGVLKYIVFIGMSFSFILYDAVMNMKVLWLYPIVRQLETLLVILIVSVYMWTLYGFVFKRHKAADSALLAASGPSRLEIDEDAAPVPGLPIMYFQEQREIKKEKEHGRMRTGWQKTLDEWSAWIARFVQLDEESEPDDEVEDRISHYTVPLSLPFSREANFEDESTAPDFDRFLKHLNLVDQERVRGTAGVYRLRKDIYLSRPATLNDLYRAYKYAGGEIDILKEQDKDKEEHGE